LGRLILGPGELEKVLGQLLHLLRRGRNGLELFLVARSHAGGIAQGHLGITGDRHDRRAKFMGSITNELLHTQEAGFDRHHRPSGHQESGQGAEARADDDRECQGHIQPRDRLLVFLHGLAGPYPADRLSSFTILERQGDCPDRRITFLILNGWAGRKRQVDDESSFGEEALP